MLEYWQLQYCGYCSAVAVLYITAELGLWVPVQEYRYNSAATIQVGSHTVDNIEEF